MDENLVCGADKANEGPSGGGREGEGGFWQTDGGYEGDTSLGIGLPAASAP